VFIATSRIFWYCLIYYSYLFAYIAYFLLLPLDIDDFENLQELKDQEFEQLAGNPGM
jgi:hypothetical protein